MWEFVFAVNECDHPTILIHSRQSALMHTLLSVCVCVGCSWTSDCCLEMRIQGGLLGFFFFFSFFFSIGLNSTLVLLHRETAATLMHRLSERGIHFTHCSRERFLWGLHVDSLLIRLLNTPRPLPVPYSCHPDTLLSSCRLGKKRQRRVSYLSPLCVVSTPVLALQELKAT